MDLLSGYQSENDEAVDESVSYQPKQSAPQLVVYKPTSSSNSVQKYVNLNSTLNTTVENMFESELGPINPFVGSLSNKATGNKLKVQEVFVEDHFFNESYQSFLHEGIQKPDRIKSSTNKDNKKRRVMEAMNTLNDELLQGVGSPWAVVSEEEARTSSQISAEAKLTSTQEAAEDEEDVELPPNMHIVEPDREAEKWEKVNERKQSYTLPPRPGRGEVAGEAKSTFHGKEERDYQGRPWTSVPTTLRGYDGAECFIPKKCLKKFVGHSKGVQAIELFPKTGHLLLSGSMDGTCKIWDVAKDRNVLRTYSGHHEAVRAINMSNDGASFLSSGFDRYVRLWDVETGKAKATFTNRKMYYQVKFYPNDNNVFLCASSDNRIYQWDIRTGAVCQEYNYHLQACNSITFFDEGRKFLSTSDDKKMLVWEYDIPVPIKYISEPEMHSIPTITTHPSGKFFCGQSMDNTIVTYACGEKVSQLKKKTFKGHNNSGFACQIGFSPNGQFMISGDGQGKLHFWDWKTTKEYRKLQAHDNGPCIGAVWHPLVPSWVFTCGWDGVIKMWD